MLKFATRLALLLLLAGTVAACDQNQVGSANMFKGKSGGAAALGNEASPIPSAASHSAPPTSNARPTQAPPPPPPTQKPQAAHFPIGIYGDTSGHGQFEPSAARVYTGTIITFTNHDSQPRSVVEADHTPALFDSGSIPPGGTWNYSAAAPGTFNYHDGTRPYAVAYFQVQNQ